MIKSERRKRGRRNRPSHQSRARPALVVMQFLCATIVFFFALFNGSVAPAYFFPMAILGAMFWAGLVIASPWQARIVPALLVAIAFAFFFIFVTWLQTSPLAGGLAEHDVWVRAADVLGPGLVQERISAHPWRSWQALPAFLMPAMAFLGALVLSQQDSDAQRLWIMLSIAGAAILVISAVLEAFFPDVAFFSPVPVGSGTFAGVFVNRNTSAAFFIISAFALLGSLLLLMQRWRVSWRDVLEPRSGQTRVDRVFIVFAMALSLFGSVILVILTQSRAGALFGLPLLALAGAATLLLSRRDGLGKGLSRVLSAAALAAVVLPVLLLAFFGEPVLQRVGGEFEDGRWCVWTDGLEAARQAPVFGYGLGSFQDIFRAFRGADCVETGTWIRAHSSFLELYLGIGAWSLIPLALVCWVFYHAIVTCMATRRRLAGFGVILFCMGLYLVMHSLVDFPLQIPGVAIYASALLGAGTGLSVARTTKRVGRSRRMDHNTA